MVLIAANLVYLDDTSRVKIVPQCSRHLLELLGRCKHAIIFRAPRHTETLTQQVTSFVEY